MLLTVFQDEYNPIRKCELQKRCVENWIFLLSTDLEVRIVPQSERNGMTENDFAYIGAQQGSYS